MSLNGYIKIHRKIIEWGWYGDPNTKAVFLHLLLTANYKETEFRGVKILPGQTVIGRKALAEVLGISERNVRTALNHLKSTNEITIKATNKFSIVTIVNWESYQLELEEPTNKVTNKPTNNRPTSDQQLTTPKEYKKDKKERNIYSDVPEAIKEPFMEWVKMRANIKKPITSKATVTRALNALYKLSKRTDRQIAIINQSTDHCWQSFYELKEQPKPKAYREFEKEPEYKSEQMPDEIRAKLGNMFKTE